MLVADNVGDVLGEAVSPALGQVIANDGLLHVSAGCFG